MTPSKAQRKVLRHLANGAEVVYRGKRRNGTSEYSIQAINGMESKLDTRTVDALAGGGWIQRTTHMITKLGRKAVAE